MGGLRPCAGVGVEDFVGMFVDVGFGAVGVGAHGRGFHEEAAGVRLVTG